MVEVTSCFLIQKNKKLSKSRIEIWSNSGAGGFCGRRVGQNTTIGGSVDGVIG